MKAFKGLILVLVILFSTVYFLTRKYPIQSVMARIVEKLQQSIDIIDIKGNKIVETDEISALFFKTNQQDKVVLKRQKEIYNDLLKIPLIKSVQIKYIMPSRLIIFVTERSPLLFYYNENLEPVMVDSDFEEFYDKRIPLKSLVFVRGKYDVEMIKNFLHVAKSFPLIYENLTEIEIFFTYRLNIVLNNKLMVELPEEREKMFPALKYLDYLIKKRNLLATSVYRLDLRNKKKTFVAVNKNVTHYVPPSSRVVLFKIPSDDQKYEEFIENAIASLPK